MPDWPVGMWCAPTPQVSELIWCSRRLPKFDRVQLLHRHNKTYVQDTVFFLYSYLLQYSGTCTLQLHHLKLYSALYFQTELCWWTVECRNIRRRRHDPTSPGMPWDRSLQHALIINWSAGGLQKRIMLTLHHSRLPTIFGLFCSLEGGLAAKFVYCTSTWDKVSVIFFASLRAIFKNVPMQFDENYHKVAINQLRL